MITSQAVFKYSPAQTPPAHTLAYPASPNQFISSPITFPSTSKLHTRTIPINRFLPITHPQAFTEDVFLMFCTWSFFEQLLEQLLPTILFHTWISVSPLCPVKAHPISSWAGHLTGPSASPPVPSQKHQQLHRFLVALPVAAVTRCTCLSALGRATTSCIQMRHCWSCSCCLLTNALLFICIP